MSGKACGTNTNNIKTIKKATDTGQLANCLKRATLVEKSTVKIPIIHAHHY